MKEIIAYRPSCCNKAMLTKDSALRHERNCFKNPGNAACPTCEFLAEEWQTFYNPHHNGNPGSTDYDYKKLWCMADKDNPINLKFGIDSFKRDCPQWKLKTGTNNA